MKLFKYLILLLFPLVSFGNVQIHGQINDIGNINTVKVYVPIGAFSNSYYTKDFPVTNGQFNIELDIEKSVFIKIRVGREPVTLAITPGDKISFTIYNTADKYKLFKFQGSNAAGHSWYNIYNFQPPLNFVKHDSLIEQASSNAANGIDIITKFLTQQVSPLDSLYQLKKINKDYYELVKTDIIDMHIKNMESILSKKASSGNENLKTLAERINQLKPVNDEIHTRTNFGAMRLKSYYSVSSENAQKSAGNAVFGPYSGYMAAPEPAKEYLLGSTLLFQLVNSSNEFSFNDADAYFNDAYPRSAFKSIIDALKGASTVIRPVSNQAEANIITDTTQTYQTFKEVTARFKGKMLYVDLWATWCMPCRAEFPNYRNLGKTLKELNIQPLFVSIDNIAFKKAWKNLIYQNQLEGYHLIADPSLKLDIQEVAYQMKQISIPRYIIVGKNGEVLDWDAPRPSDPKLVDALKKYL